MEGKTMKIGEFAAKYGVTDRHARRLAAACEADLVGHIEKRGNAGTWIDEYAEAHLRDKLRNPLEILPAPPEEADPAELQRELNEMTRKWAEAEQRASLGAAAVARLEAAEQKTLLLQDVHAEAMNRKEAEHKAEVAGLQAEYSRQIGDLEGTNRILTEERNYLQEELTTALTKITDREREYEMQTERAAYAAEKAENARKVAEARLAAVLAKQDEIDRAPFYRRGKLRRELKDLQDQARKE